MNLCQRLLVSFGGIAHPSFRNKFLRIAGMRIGDRTRITKGFYVDKPDGVTIGTQCFFNHFVHLHNEANKDTTISLGDKVFVGQTFRLCAIPIKSDRNINVQGKIITVQSSSRTVSG